MRVGFHVADEKFIRSSMNFVTRQGNNRIRNLKKLDLISEGARRKHMTTVYFGDDFQFMDYLRNGTTSSDAYVSQNSPSDDLLYSKSNCDVVFISGRLL